VDVVERAIEEALTFALSEMDAVTGAYPQPPPVLDLPEGLYVYRFVLTKER
jgi:hypothetical protein